MTPPNPVSTAPVTPSPHALEEKLEALEKVRSWGPRVISRLEQLLRTTDDLDLYRVSPIRYAQQRGMPESEAMDLFIHAARIGLFDMDWQLVCPSCSDVVKSFSTLRELDKQYHCNICHTTFEGHLDDGILVSFTVSPSVRELRFHHPDKLSALEYAFVHKGSVEGVDPEGVPVVNRIQQGLKFMEYLPPHQDSTFSFQVEPPGMLGFDIESNAAFILPVSGAPATQPQVVHVTYRPGACEVDVESVAPGPISLQVHNASGHRGILGVCAFDPARKPQNVKFPKALLAKQLLTHPTFREVFGSEVVRHGDGISVRHMTFLFTDLKGSTELYDRVGDLPAFALVRQHFEILASATARHGGCIVKTIGDAIMATFGNASDGMAAAVEMVRQCSSFTHATGGGKIILKVGLHTGASIAVTLDDRLDYFGQTVNIAARVQGLADANEIYFTQSVHEAPGVAEIIKQLQVSRQSVKVKGVNRVDVYRTTVA